MQNKIQNFDRTREKMYALHSHQHEYFFLSCWHKSKAEGHKPET